MRKQHNRFALEAADTANHVSRRPGLPSDLRLGNLLRVLDEIQRADAVSRSELARLTTLGVPTVHRLILDLVALGLIEEIPPHQDGIHVGRPATSYRLYDRGMVVAGVDIGNETTRFILATPSGKILARRTRLSVSIRRQLVESVVDQLRALTQEAGIEPERLAAVGIGVSAAVNPETGCLENPPRHSNWQGLPLGALVQEQIGCPVLVRQDDHFAAIAEGSDAGTFPGAQSLVVVEIGTGIGAALMVDGVTMRGAHGRFGRIAGWPVSVPRRGMAKSTLGANLVAAGLVEDYHRRGGKRELRDGSSLFQAAADGDVIADAVLAWAGHEIAELVIRLYRLCDPTGVVLGGGIARGFEILEPHLRPHLPTDIVLQSSVLGEDAVVIGAVLSLRSYAEAWVTRSLAELEPDGQKTNHRELLR